MRSLQYQARPGIPDPHTAMENSTPSGPPELLMAELAKALHGWRDALVNVSLALQDYQFDLDENGRQEVSHAMQGLLERTKKSTKHSEDE